MTVTRVDLFIHNSTKSSRFGQRVKSIIIKCNSKYWQETIIFILMVTRIDCTIHDSTKSSRIWAMRKTYNYKMQVKILTRNSKLSMVSRKT